MGMMIALQSLEKGLQQQLCTGLRVADSTGERRCLCGRASNAMQAANCNGKPLIGDITGSDGSCAHVARAHPTFSGSALYGSIACSSSVQAQTSGLVNQQKADGMRLNTIGNAMNDGNPQVTNNTDRIALDSGIGALVDADLDNESAQLTALQLRQLLATEAPSVANQAPQTLLSLFK